MECFDVHAIHVAHFYTKLNAQNHLYVKNIAEDVEVKINSVLEPYKKN